MATKSHLFTYEKDELYRQIQQTGLNPGDFKWEDEVDTTHLSAEDMKLVRMEAMKVGERLTHTPTEFYFVIIDRRAKGILGGRHEHDVKYRPSNTKREDGVNDLDWNTVVEHCVFWLLIVKREYEAPDLWKQLAESPLPTLKSDVDEAAKFTEREVERVNASVVQLVEAIRDNSEKLDFAREQLDYLIEAVDALKSLAPALTKRQFVHNLSGIAFTILFQVAYNPERTIALMTMIGDAFNWLVQVNLYLPKGG